MPPKKNRKPPRGLAAASPETRAQVASIGGLAISKNRAHMSAIGRLGGKAVSANLAHMATIGRKGGLASWAAKRVSADASGH